MRRGFDSRRTDHGRKSVPGAHSQQKHPANASVAQRPKQTALTRKIVGSTPTGCTVETSNIPKSSGSESHPGGRSSEHSSPGRFGAGRPGGGVSERPTMTSPCSSVDRALPCEGRGRGFESHQGGPQVSNSDPRERSWCRTLNPYNESEQQAAQCGTFDVHRTCCEHTRGGSSR